MKTIYGVIACCVICLVGFSFVERSSAMDQQQQASADIPSAQLIQPENLAKLLQSPKHDKLLIIQVGFRRLYDEAHIPGSEYIGPASTAEGLQQLRARVEHVGKNTAIVLYCGCCPWTHCPNVRPAFGTLQDMGFKNVKLLYIADNFGANWVDKGYPTEGRR